MPKSENKIVIPEELLMKRIYVIRGQKVMLDRDLSELYGVSTKIFKQAVRRNIERFPNDFMFEMTQEELENWRSHFVTSNSDKMGLRHPPFCFTEQWVTMLSEITKSETAIRVNIQIIRVFTRMRAILLSHKDILLQLEKVEWKLTGHDADIALVFSYLKQFLQPPQKPRPEIGFERRG